MRGPATPVGGEDRVAPDDRIAAGRADEARIVGQERGHPLEIAIVVEDGIAGDEVRDLMLREQAIERRHGGYSGRMGERPRERPHIARAPQVQSAGAAWRKLDRNAKLHASETL